MKKIKDYACITIDAYNRLLGNYENFKQLVNELFENGLSKQQGGSEVVPPLSREYYLLQMGGWTPEAVLFLKTLGRERTPEDEENIIKICKKYNFKVFFTGNNRIYYIYI